MGFIVKAAYHCFIYSLLSLNFDAFPNVVGEKINSKGHLMAHVGKVSFNEVNCCEIFNTSLIMILNQTESTNAVSVFAGDPIDISLSSSLRVKSSLDQNLNTTHQNLRSRIKTKLFRHAKSKSKRTRQRLRNVHLMARRLRKKLKTILESTPIDWYEQMDKVVGRKVNLMLIFTEHQN